MMSPGPPQVFVHNRQRKILLDESALQDFARRALPLCAKERGSGLTNLQEVHVILISDRRMSALHRRFMQITGPTDVITFDHGEIFISVETARRQARSYRKSLGHELRLYLVHGLLHLRGFEDATPAARRRMERAQEHIVRQAST
ncbi:MAG TPA: rRNA maturation RNase YbeY [Chthoniobacterales bacterium]